MQFQSAIENIYIRLTDKSNEDVNYKIEIIDKKNLSKLSFKNNVLIRDCDEGIVKKFLKDYVLEDKYDDIKEARGLYDNYLKRINFYFICYIPFILCNILFIILGYPFYYNVKVMLLFKVLNVLVSKFVYGKMRYDTDIMTRSVRDRGKILYKQELLVIFCQCFFIFFGLGIVYMYFMTNLMDVIVSNSIFLICYVYMLFWITIVNMSEKILVINLVKSYNNYLIICYLVVCILINVLLIMIKSFGIYEINFRNSIGCICYSLLFVVVSDLFKLARYTSVKKIKEKKK